MGCLWPVQLMTQVTGFRARASHQAKGLWTTATVFNFLSDYESCPLSHRHSSSLSSAQGALRQTSSLLALRCTLGLVVVFKFACKYGGTRGL